MDQMSFSDAEYRTKRKQTRREKFLGEMDQVIPWGRLEKRIEPFYRKSGGRFPPLAVRQWVLSLPKRLRYFLRQDRQVVTAVLNIFLRVVEQALREHAPDSAEKARMGAVSFVHHFGSALNEHLHFHCCVIDGVFESGPEGEEAVRFQESGLTTENIQWVQNRVLQRVLRWFANRGYLDKDHTREMAQWGNGGGFSVDASVRIEGHDRAGLERLLRYCARPPFALERLQSLNKQ